VILLKDCCRLVGLDGDELQDVDMLVQGNRITRIAKDIPAPAGARVIDASHLVVAPGLVNTHHHFYQTLTRNLPAVQSAKLLNWSCLSLLRYGKESMKKRFM